MNALATPWHEGERALQARAGVAARMAEVGPRVVRDHMPEQHREFFALLPFLLVGTLEDDGQPRASVVAGPPGFAHSPDPRLLRIDARSDGDGVREGAPIGLLGLQAHTGRRNRMNGTVVDCGPLGFSVQVAQSFGNCPKYIHPREAFYVPAADVARTERLARLDDAARAQVAAADTFFIASAHPRAGAPGDAASGVDISHRGGPAGFVRVQGDGTLLVPDYVGNSFFATLGNLQLEPRCSLLFIDPAAPVRLRIAARAELLWDDWDRAAFPGALRVLRLEVFAVERTTGGWPLRFSAPSAVPGPAAR